MYANPTLAFYINKWAHIYGRKCYNCIWAVMAQQRQSTYFLLNKDIGNISIVNHTTNGKTNAQKRTVWGLKFESTKNTLSNFTNNATHRSQPARSYHGQWGGLGVGWMTSPEVSLSQSHSALSLSRISQTIEAIYFLNFFGLFGRSRDYKNHKPSIFGPFAFRKCYL